MLNENVTFGQVKRAPKLITLSIRDLRFSFRKSANLLCVAMDGSIKLYRALIRTHHITSPKKVSQLSKAAKKLECSVYLKTGPHPPGVMIVECEGETDKAKQSLDEWVKNVKVSFTCLFLSFR